MFPGLESVRVFVRPGPTDMRKSINGLSAIAQQAMAGDPFSGGLFVFSNRRRNILKILYWQRNGFCLWMKHLEKDRFPWPCDERECVGIGEQELRWLLDGVDFWNRHGTLNFSRVI